ncbi:hypothetical protein [Paractinoplanes brasiliensis]|uniref:Secreted protein n=1 Tax=Paractinoplanes brasiliensis TaxID=52695 RepID=A0A4R6K280_9ACTN|nr:hypothetical protein [Actinoplanes brasiliensis]TDO42422.1 hypothetical protein C8E87_6194 [Actinoplanes brasiliensis]GID29656.1 hypothetical protein Abr02nite_46390 [Actinoplanes brasiliensis]
MRHRILALAAATAAVAALVAVPTAAQAATAADTIPLWQCVQGGGVGLPSSVNGTITSILCFGGSSNTNNVTNDPATGCLAPTVWTEKVTVIHAVPYGTFRIPYLTCV